MKRMKKMLVAFLIAFCLVSTVAEVVVPTTQVEAATPKVTIKKKTTTVIYAYVGQTIQVNCKGISTKLMKNSKKFWWIYNSKQLKVTKTGKVKIKKAGYIGLTGNKNGTFYNLDIISLKKSTYKKVQNIVKTYAPTTLSTYERVKAIHDYIINNCVYDTSSSGTSDDYTGVLEDGKAVCDGYATTFKMLMDFANIPCKKVSGTADNGNGGGSQPHAWNLVKIDGNWYQVDCTWDDPVVAGIDASAAAKAESLGDIHHGWFLLSDASMNATHTADQGVSYPQCSQDYPNRLALLYPDYIFCSTVDEAKTKMVEACSSGLEEWHIVLPYSLADDTAIYAIINSVTNNPAFADVIDFYNISNCNYVFERDQLCIDCVYPRKG